MAILTAFTEIGIRGSTRYARIFHVKNDRSLKSHSAHLRGKLMTPQINNNKNSESNLVKTRDNLN